ncbi:MAG TPA: matrixin family metalloprotease [Candidatus Pacearchaeota archaeon]|nr:matrixin family metalloprotease [Candidatus Pacearchaeota archaeon]
MRFPTKTISYRIDNCPLQKKGDMNAAFNILENRTSLTFYPVLDDEQIYVTCDSKAKIEGGMFIAGEGGPTNITSTINFNVILNGKILLIKDSRCSEPNVAIHELLHVLGFKHSNNKNNIMYNYSDCGQTIGQDSIDLIDNIYDVPDYPDLAIENVSAVMNGKYLDANISIRNNGLRRSSPAKLIISADDKVVKEFDVKGIEIGYGTIITLSNVWISKISIDELNFLIESDFKELEKSNNQIKLKIKK